MSIFLFLMQEYLFPSEWGEHLRLSMTRRDIVTVDILIFLSSASTPLISFVSFLFLPRSCGSSLLLPFINPSFLSLFPIASLFSSTCRLYLFFRIPPYSCFLHRNLRSAFSFFHPAFCAYPVIISSPFLCVFFYRSTSLPRFSLLSTLSRVTSPSFCLYLIPFSSPSLFCSASFIAQLPIFFLYSSIFSYLFSSSFYRIRAT